ncbi:DMT family transporter [Anaeroselena agilis]|uniref:DMT family transporter n=1 Tax=Anaeroselena agilis TaxID=3063788 RepID=A0ABU3NVP9_9FIRM|nr:DMT family transporter [Selenomonadales bacterium 4137-cl]
MDLVPAHLLPLLLALVSGVLMAVQGSLNTALSKTVGLWEATFVVHAVGTLVLLVVLYLLKMGQGDLGALPQAPWYSYLGGVISVFIIYLVAASIPRVGVANATTAIIVGQVLTAVIIDHVGGFGLQKIPCGWNQVAGLALLAVGAKLLLK